MTAADLARAWIDGWNAGTPDDIPLADDFTHSSPYGTVSGRQKYLEWVKPLAAQNVAELRVVSVLGGGDEAAIWFEMDSGGQVVKTVDWVRVRDGQIVSIQSFYDPRGLEGLE